MFEDRRRLAIIVGLGVLLVCIVCGVIYIFVPSGEEEGEPTSVAEIPAEATTEVAPPDETPLPTEPPEPTNTPEPTSTPEPTATPTEVPTPTPVPDPVYLIGEDDSVVDFENPFTVSIVRISGNLGSHHFAIKAHDLADDSYDLLVNTTDPYTGIRLMDPRDTHTTRFEITATGTWAITIESLQSSRMLEVPGTIEGTGDDVIILTGGTPDLANIKGNEQENHFAVKGYGSRRDLLVNTTDPYEGTVVLASDTVVIEITAVGHWSIEVIAK